ncbi:LamG-like jellyroll fold domain-containing protein [Microlunatus sp. GCM10028923]|uniref:LamG-like jellyroll fold domain-containing protein n=1 Tax=Microlunatus sp. GCM10028923 TaxID=3273400 RepID=UPI003605CEC3
MVERNGRIAPVATTVPIAFSAGGDAALVTIGKAGRKIALHWPGRLPEPSLKGDTATYPEVFPGVDLRMRAVAQGYKMILVVKTSAAARNPALRKLDFGVRGDGLVLRADKNGNVAVYDPSGKVAFGVGAPMMWDSTPGEARRAVGKMRVGRNTLSVEPDRALLNDRKARFPLYIDPDTVGPRTGFAQVFSGYPGQAYWGGDGSGVAKVGRCYEDGTCNGVGIARSYFTFDVKGMAGKHVLGAEFNAFLAYTPSCSAREVGAWGTNRVGSGTTWNNQPGVSGGIDLSSHNAAGGWSSNCPSKWLGWQAGDVVRSAVAFNEGIATIMLAARNENDQLGWKKFIVDNGGPSLSVTYNSYPSKPSGLQVDHKACALEPNEPYLNPFIDDDPNEGPRGPRLWGTASDPDGGLVHAQFEWYTRGGQRLGTAATSELQSNSAFSVDVPAKDAADGTKLSYRVRGADGTDFGPWSDWCHVTIDRTAPAIKPSVKSQTYPECPPPYDDCPVGGGAGRAGAFVFSAGGDPDVAGFRYDLHDQPQTYVAADADKTATILLTPPEDGDLDLYARSVDRAGNLGPLYRYHFMVGEGTPPVGHWRLEGTQAPDVHDDSPNGHDGSIPADSFGWRPGRHGDALWLNGSTGSVETTGGPTVHTNKSFAVAAWVRLDRVDAEAHTAVSQEGSRTSGFFLRYDPGTKKWAFALPAADADGAVQVSAQSTYPAVAERWTHLVGVYDLAAKQARIYVDGVAGTAVSHTTPWDAGGSARLGRGQAQGAPTEYWPGAIDEVRIYDRSLASEEIVGLAGTPAVEQLFWPLDESSGRNADDVSGNYRLGTLRAAASHVDGQVGPGAVRLDGGSSPLSTSTPVVRTDSGFTVSAWVRLERADDATQTVLSQDGSRNSGFQLRYRGDTKRWSFAIPTSDRDGTRVVTADSREEAQSGEWTHLVGVFDQPAQRVRLYVNSALETAVPISTDTWQANGTFQVGQGRQLGAPATPLTGEVDDVHAWTGVRTPDQIKADYLDPVTKRSSAYGGQLARYYNTAGHRIVTDGPVPAGSHFERSLGHAAPDGAPNTRTIYSCRNGATDYFLAGDCGNHTKLGAVGSVYLTPPDDVPTIPVYRCLIPNAGHFASTDPQCEGHTAEFLLGHTRAYAQLIRHVTTGRPWDHSSSTGESGANYRPEQRLGTLAMKSLPGTKPLYSCVAGDDTFSSLDPSCEGKTTVTSLGWIWEKPPAGIGQGVEVFRCRSSWGDLFDSSDPGCEGQAVDRSLGFALTGL